MVKQHLKRLASPRTWPIHKKTLTFVSRPLPGPHSLEHQLPISVILRDLLGVVRTNKEAKFILHNKECLVDGKPVYDDKRPAGLLDTISLPKIGKHYRISINDKNKLVALEITEKEAGIKATTIKNKTSAKGGKIQLTTTGGRTLLVPTGEYKVGDAIIISVPDQKVSKKLPLKAGMTVKLIGGSHVGASGSVKKIEGNIIYLEVNGEELHTDKSYAIVVGEKESAITV